MFLSISKQPQHQLCVKIIFFTLRCSTSVYIKLFGENFIQSNLISYTTKFALNRSEQQHQQKYFKTKEYGVVTYNL